MPIENNITFVNLLDLDITLETLDGSIISLPALDQKLRLPKVSNMVIKTDVIGDMPFNVKYKHPDIKYLPAPRTGVIYLVSGMISEVAERDDVLTPSEINAVKVKGRVVAYRELTRYTRNFRKNNQQTKN